MGQLDLPSKPFVVTLESEGNKHMVRIFNVESIAQTRGHAPNLIKTIEGVSQGKALDIITELECVDFDGVDRSKVRREILQLIDMLTKA